MILIDAGGLVSFLAGEPAAPHVREMLRSGEASIAAPNLAETIDILVRVMRNDLDQIESVIVPLVATVLPVIPVGEPEARRGAAFRVAHYHRTRAPLSLADCLLLGTAAALGAGLATSDPPLAEVARTEGIDVIPLKDSRGHRP